MNGNGSDRNGSEIVKEIGWMKAILRSPLKQDRHELSSVATSAYT